MLYLLGFSKPLGDVTRTRMSARRYLGCCKDGRFDERLEEHLAGRGAKIVAAALAMGAEVIVLLKIPLVGYEAERRLKAAGHFDRLERRLPRWLELQVQRETFVQSNPHLAETVRDDGLPF